jgi:ABC-type nitrate/sulfonate/bicarbonate transport system ATPase subunit
MTASPAVALDRITKSYGELRVLEEITLAVAEGETVAIVGPSGCGKSTLLRIILGLEAASSGEVVSHRPARRGPPVGQKAGRDPDQRREQDRTRGASQPHQERGPKPS